MAEIFLARGAGVAGLERYCVLKRILRERAGDAQFVQMFIDEARLAAQLQHPNIASVYDIGMLGDSYFFTMEYVHGETVRALVQRAQGLRRPLPLACVLTIIAGTAAGLHHAHERNGNDGRPLGIVHRDISPSNLMVSFEGNVKIVDFGVAKADDRQVKTQSGTVKGKISYLSPEQCRSTRVDRRSDLFSLGIVMWEMLTGARLYRRANDFEILSAIIGEPAPLPSSRRPDVPAAIDGIVQRLLAKSPGDRYQTAAEVVEAIEDASMRAGTILSSSAVSHLLRDLFGARAEPWLEIESDTLPLRHSMVVSRPLPRQLGRTVPDPVEQELAAVPDLDSHSFEEASGDDSMSAVDVDALEPEPLPPLPFPSGGAPAARTAAPAERAGRASSAHEAAPAVPPVPLRPSSPSMHTAAARPAALNARPQPAPPQPASPAARAAPAAAPAPRYTGPTPTAAPSSVEPVARGPVAGPALASVATVPAALPPAAAAKNAQQQPFALATASASTVRDVALPNLADAAMAGRRSAAVPTAAPTAATLDMPPGAIVISRRTAGPSPIVPLDPALVPTLVAGPIPPTPKSSPVLSQPPPQATPPAAFKALPAAAAPAKISPVEPSPVRTASPATASPEPATHPEAPPDARARGWVSQVTTLPLRRVGSLSAHGGPRLRLLRVLIPAAMAGTLLAWILARETPHEPRSVRIAPSASADLGGAVAPASIPPSEPAAATPPSSNPPPKELERETKPGAAPVAAPDGADRAAESSTSDASPREPTSGSRAAPMPDDSVVITDEEETPTGRAASAAPATRPSSGSGATRRIPFDGPPRPGASSPHGSGAAPLPDDSVVITDEEETPTGGAASAAPVTRPFSGSGATRRIPSDGPSRPGAGTPPPKPPKPPGASGGNQSVMQAMAVTLEAKSQQKDYSGVLHTCRQLRGPDLGLVADNCFNAACRERSLGDAKRWLNIGKEANRRPRVANCKRLGNLDMSPYTLDCERNPLDCHTAQNAH